MKSYIKLFLFFIRYALLGRLEYRFDFFANILRSLGWFFVGLFGFHVIFGQTTVIAGWSKAEALTLFGVFSFINQLWYMFFSKNLLTLPEKIRTGEFDFILLKPRSAQFLTSLREIQLFNLPNVILACGVIIYYSSQTHLTIGIERYILGILLMMNGLLILYCLMLIVISCAFWTVKMESYWHVYQILTEGARYPISFFKNPLRAFFTFIIPIAVIFTFPAQSIVKDLSLWLVIFSFMLGGVFFLLSRYIFNLGIKYYNSASS